MSWQLLRLACRCWRCQTAIEPGDLARVGDRTPGVWCVACAAKDGHHPPAEFLEPAAPVPAPVALAATAPDVPETLFALEPDGAKFKHADARLAFDRLRARITPADDVAAEGGEL